MEPQISYVRSADGTRIALRKLGQGPPLVAPTAIGFLSMASFWRVPEERQGMERVAQRRTVVRFDNRGHGLSEREVNDFSLEARIADLHAVVTHVSSSPVDLYVGTVSSPIGIAFAAQHPDRVRRLVLWSGGTAGGASPGPSGSQYAQLQLILRQLIHVDWEAYVRIWSMIIFGWNEIGLKVGEDGIESTSPEVFIASQRAARRYDATEFLPRVQCPTLVMHRRNAAMSLDISKNLASTIPNARLVLFDQNESLMFGGRGTEILETFLDESEAIAQQQDALPSGTAVILFTDIADSTGLTERLGDAAFRAKARELGPALRALVRECGGTPVEGPTLGDGVLAVFTSAREAIRAALRCAHEGGHAGLPLHLGIHAGDVTREKDPDGRDNVYGGAVNIAARISGLSAPGEVLVSQTVRDLARTSAGVRFEDRGEQSLKGVGEAVRVWAVREAE